jgi:hypothetical protein
MAADLSVYVDFGGSDGNAATNQDTDALGPPRIRFKRADDATIDNNDPMVIPAAGTNYSRWKHVYLYCDTGPSTQVNNIKFYSDGGGWANVTLNVNTGSWPLNNSLDRESGYQVADTEDQAMNGGHDGVSGVASAFTYTSGSPLAGPTITEAGGIINAVGEMTDYLIMQMEVTSSASPGDLADETLTFQYDEI